MKLSHVSIPKKNQFFYLKKMSQPSTKQIILTSSPDGPITAYDVSTAATVANFSGSRSPSRGLTIVGESFFAASHLSLSSSSCSVHLYNWYSQTPLHKIHVPEPVAPLIASLDGSYIFAGSISGNIHVIGVPSGDFIRSVAVHQKPVSCLGIGEDGSVLISGFEDGKIIVNPIFELLDDGIDKNCFTSRKFRAHDGSVTAIASFALKIASCSVDYTCKIWSILNGTLLQILEFSSEILSVAALAADPTETQLYFGGSDGLIYKGSVNLPGKEKHVNQNRSEIFGMGSKKHKSPVVSVVMANEGRTLVSAGEDGDLFFWEIETGNLQLGFNGTERSISEMVVLDRYGDRSRFLVNLRERFNFFGVCNRGIVDSSGLATNLLSRKVEDRLDLEDVLMVARQDRSKAIAMLESAIAMYEKLLELVLKEASRKLSIGGDVSEDQKAPN